MQFCRKWPGSSVGCRTDHEPALCPSGKQGNSLWPALGCVLPVGQGSWSFPSTEPWWDTSGVLCQVLGKCSLFPPLPTSFPLFPLLSPFSVSSLLFPATLIGIYSELVWCHLYSCSFRIHNTVNKNIAILSQHKFLSKNLLFFCSKLESV